MAVFDNLGGGVCNMKYDPETDIKYLKNQDGEWTEVGYGGLLTKWIYHEGKIVVPISSTGYTFSSNFTGTTPTYAENSINITLTAGKSCTIGTTDTYNLSEITKFHVKVIRENKEEVYTLDLTETAGFGYLSFAYRKHNDTSVVTVPMLFASTTKAVASSTLKKWEGTTSYYADTISIIDMWVE